MIDKDEVFCTIQLGREGNVIDVRDANGKSHPVAKARDSHPTAVGGTAPSGKKIKAVICIELVTVEKEDPRGKGDQGRPADKGEDYEDHENPCWIKDALGNWRCVCPESLC